MNPKLGQIYHQIPASTCLAALKLIPDDAGPDEMRDAAVLFIQSQPESEARKQMLAVFDIFISTDGKRKRKRAKDKAAEV